MSLNDYEAHMMRCSRCSYCKFVPWIKADTEFFSVCPSIERYNFHAYSAGGRLAAGLAFLRERLEYSDGLLDVIYKCQMCGACDVSCKISRDLEPFEAMLEFRSKCVEDGQLLPGHMAIIESLRKEDNVMQCSKSDRGKWAEGLEVKDLAKENADVIFHAGCRFSFDKELWEIAQRAITLLKKAGVDIGIMGKEEVCCGGRAYEIGYQGEFTKYMDHNIEIWKTRGIKTVVTACSDCYGTFKAWYSRFGHKEFKIFHITEYLNMLIREGKITFKNKIPLTITYHDPCHLGRLSEPYEYHSPGKPYFTPEKKVAGQLIVHDPPKPWRRGANGVYDAPREVLRSIPGLRFVEMKRIKEYAWCCGAGGGVKEAYPDFSIWTAWERIREAKSTGAEALVTACPWCEQNFKDALNERGDSMKVYDVIELVEQAI